MLMASGVFVLLSRRKGNKNLWEDSGHKSLLRVETNSGLVGATPETKLAGEFDVLAFVYRTLWLSRDA